MKQSAKTKVTQIQSRQDDKSDGDAIIQIQIVVSAALPEELSTVVNMEGFAKEWPVE